MPAVIAWLALVAVEGRGSAQNPPVTSGDLSRGGTGHVPAPTYPRALSDHEAEVLAFLLSVDDARLEPVRAQATSAVVTGMCACGCATVHLAVDRQRYPPANLCSPVVSTTTRLAEDEQADPSQTFGLLVFLDQGWLSQVEIWYIDEPPLEFPDVATFDAPRLEC
jgi:hypothetical protein